MKVIDFIGSGAEDLIYVLRERKGAPILWRGTRQDFIREMSAFFLLFYRTVTVFDVDDAGVLTLYI